MRTLLSRFCRTDSGATAIEYGLITALMAVAVIAAVAALSPKLQTAFDTIGTNLGSHVAATAPKS